MAHIYILESLKTGRYYIGSCDDFNNRVRRHNAGQVSATRKFIPYQIVFNKKIKDIAEARSIESKLKKLKRRDYIQKIIKSGEITLRAISSSGRAGHS